MRFAIVLSALSAAALAACATSEETVYQSLDEDPRVGERENQICFTRTIRGFADYQRGEGIVLIRSGGDRYLVTFAGPCFAARGAQAVGLNNRFAGGGCIGRGDRIYLTNSFTGEPSGNSFTSDTCMIRDIHRFDPDAGAEAE